MYRWTLKQRTMFHHPRYRHRQQDPIIPKRIQQWLVRCPQVSHILPNKPQPLLNSSKLSHNHPVTLRSLINKAPMVCQTLLLPPVKVLFCISLNICIQHPTDRTNTNNNNHRNHLRGIHILAANLPATMVNNPTPHRLRHHPSTNQVSIS